MNLWNRLIRSEFSVFSSVSIFLIVVESLAGTETNLHSVFLNDRSSI